MRFTSQIRAMLTRWGYFAEDNPGPFSREGRTQMTDASPEPYDELGNQAEEHVNALQRRTNVRFEGSRRASGADSGIGVLSALVLHLELQTVDRFPSAEAVVSYFGLDTVVEQRGDDR